MRSGDFSVHVVVNGQELGEQADGVVALGFGDEYSLRFRTYNHRRAVAQVWIDGVDITGGGLVIPAYGWADLHTPPASPGQRFRFASTESQAAAAAGKEGPDIDGTKGLIRVEFRSEKRPAYVKAMDIPRLRKPLFSPWGRTDRMWHDPETTKRMDFLDYESRMYEGPITCDASPRSSQVSAPAADSLMAGVTVAGSHSSQTFVEEHVDLESTRVTVLLKLKGFVREATVSCLPPAPAFADAGSGLSHSVTPNYSDFGSLQYATNTISGRDDGVNFCSHCGARLSSLSNLCPSCSVRVR
jgi:hypothetical protein